MSKGFVEIFLDNVDMNLDNYVFDSYASLSAELLPTIKLLFILFWVIYGISIMKGLVDFHIKDFANQAFRLILIFVFLTNWSIFNTFVYELFTETPAFLGGKMMNGSSTSGVNAALDKILSRSLFAAEQLITKSPTMAIGTKIIGTIFLGIMLFLIAYATYLIVLSKVAIALLLGLAPVFLVMLVFKKTSGLFEGWLRQVINFAIIPILTYGLLVLVIAIIKSDLAAIDKFISYGVTTKTTTIYSMIFTALISIGLFLQIMGIASGIAGGIQLGGMAESFTRNTKKAGKLAGQALGKIRRTNSIRN